MLTDMVDDDLSSGGLICRGFLEAYPDHNVKTFISLSSPQAGQFGGWIHKNRYVDCAKNIYIYVDIYMECIYLFHFLQIRST